MSPEELAKSLTAEFDKIEVKEIDFLAERVRALISYSIDRVDYYEDYRTRFLAYSGSLLAFSSAFAAFIISYQRIPKNSLPYLLLGVAVLICTCLISALLYFHDSIYPSYPHRPVSQTQWYYLYNLNRFNRVAQNYLGNSTAKTRQWLLDLRDNIRKLSEQGKKEMVFDDIEQLVILYIITAYKKNFAERMQNTLTVGIIVFSIVMLISILSVIW
jgi:hypothetical protein